MKCGANGFNEFGADVWSFFGPRLRITTEPPPPPAPAPNGHKLLNLQPQTLNVKPQILRTSTGHFPKKRGTPNVCVYAEARGLRENKTWDDSSWRPRAAGTKLNLCRRRSARPMTCPGLLQFESESAALDLARHVHASQDEIRNKTGWLVRHVLRSFRGLPDNRFALKKARPEPASQKRTLCF